MKYRDRNNLARLLLCSASLYLAASSVFANTEKRWEFHVYLDDKRIGHHTVRLVSDLNKRKIEVDAQFDVKFLFVRAYYYEHRTEEVWEGSCLTDIQSDTDDNGKKLYVRALPASNGVQLETHNGNSQITGCVRSFAYWDPELLRSGQLLNTQTGEYQSVDMEYIGESPLDINGLTFEAYQYSLLVEGKQIDLWYTPDMDWLALETTVRGGRRLTYYPANAVIQ